MKLVLRSMIELPLLIADAKLVICVISIIELSLLISKWKWFQESDILYYLFILHLLYMYIHIYLTVHFLVEKKLP